MGEFYFPTGKHDEQPLNCACSLPGNSAAVNVHVSCTVEVTDDNTCRLVISAVRAARENDDDD